MTLSAIDKVRSLIGDMTKIAVRESVVEGSDGVTTRFQLDMFPVRTGTLEAVVSGQIRASATANYLLGVLDFTGVTKTPTAGAQVLASYQYNALSDDEIQNSIDLASGGGSLLAAAISARALAGNFARFFSYTQGAKSVDKNLLSKKLLDLAESLEKSHKTVTTQGNVTLTVGSFDDSGTVFENYDTAVATIIHTMTATS